MGSPQSTLKKTENFAKALLIAKTKEIAVGLPANNSLTKQVYAPKPTKSESKKKAKARVDKAKTVLEIGIIHEFGLGNNPVRSFLKMPFKIKETQIKKAFSVSFKRVLDGNDPIQQMERLGFYLQNISLASFNNKGYGKWEPLKPETVKRKGGSEAILTDTATLKRSITAVVRNAS